MEYQNVTLSLPKEVLRQAKHLAIERGTSLSGLLSGLLAELVQQEDVYRKAKATHLSMLNEFDLGTEGCLMAKRSELHAR